MRRAAPLILAVVLLLTTAGSAKAQVCGCDLFAHAFAQNRGNAQHVFNVHARRAGIGPVNRRRIRRRLYDWERERVFNPSFCDKHAKVCAAARACLVAGGFAFVGEKLNGASDPRAARNAAVACAAAATAVLVV